MRCHPQCSSFHGEIKRVRHLEYFSIISLTLTLYSYGSIEVGKWADFVLVDAPSWQHLIYQIGDPPIGMVIKKGVPVYERSQTTK